MPVKTKKKASNFFMGTARIVLMVAIVKDTKKARFPRGMQDENTNGGFWRISGKSREQITDRTDIRITDLRIVQIVQIVQMEIFFHSHICKIRSPFTLSAEKNRKKFVQPKGFIYICNQKVSYFNEKRCFPGDCRSYAERDFTHDLDRAAECKCGFGTF